MVKSTISLVIFILQVFAIQAQHRAYHTSLNFDGLDDYIDCNTSNRNITTQVTIEAWVRTNSNKTQWVAGKYDSVANQGCRLFIQNGRAAFGGSTANGISVGSGFSLTNVKDNKWHHVAGTYTAGTWQIWVDGILESSNTNLPVSLPNNAVLTIGRNSVTNSQHFSGNMGEVRIWNTARTQRELRDFMCQYLKNKSLPLVGYFTLSRGSSHNANQGSIATDESATRLNGTLLTFGSIWNFMETPPPIGIESIHFYDTISLNSDYHIVGPGDDNADTLITRILSGQPKGLHLYRTDIIALPVIGGTLVSNLDYYFGVLTVGDTVTTYQATHPSDTLRCRIDYYLFKRKNSFQPFRKTTSSNFILSADKVNEATGKDRGEYYFPYKIPPLRNYFNGTKTTCGESLPPTTLTSSRGYTFLWNTGDTSRSIEITKPGKFYVTSIDICSSISTDTFRVTLTKPLVFPLKLVSDTLVCESQPLTLNLPITYAYQWPDGSNGNQYVITQPGNYSVEVTEPNCQSTKTYSFYVKAAACTENVFIPNIITPNGDNLNDHFTIVGLPLSKWHLQIYNRWGKQVYQSENYKNNWNGNNLSGGTYYYLLKHKQNAKTYKGFVELVK